MKIGPSLLRRPILSHTFALQGVVKALQFVDRRFELVWVPAFLDYLNALSCTGGRQ